MRIYVYVPLLVTVVLAVVTPRLAPRLIPRHAAWALVCVAVMTAAGWLGSLSLLAFTAFAQIPEVAQEGRWSIPLLRAEDPVDFAVSVACSLTLVTAFVGLGISIVRQVRDVRWARRESRRLPGRTELALLDDETPQAFTIAGKPARIVVTRGMLRCLDREERAAMLAHERAHLRNRHHLFQAVWRLTAAVNPLLRPVVGAGGFVLERWADEDAADRVGDRTVVARAVARAALASSAVARPRADTLAATGGAVPQRVKSLLAPAPRDRLLPFVVGGVLLALCWTSLFEAASDSEQLVDFAQKPICAATDQAHPAARIHHSPATRHHRGSAADLAHTAAQCAPRPRPPHKSADLVIAASWTATARPIG